MDHIRRMQSLPDDLRPSIASVTCPIEFDRWYWPVSDLVAMCERLGIAKSGRKAELRERVLQSLRGVKVVASKSCTTRAKGVTDWRRAALSADTTITPCISFGPNVRNFFKAEIGSKFVCHSDFMDWVKTNTGATLGDAIQAWHVLEARKDDPTFRREIAECNNYLQYLRDLRDANPGCTLEDAKKCWDQKKLRPANSGIVIYEASDLRFIRA